MYVKLAFCPGAGPADNSCSSSGAPKFGSEAVNRVLLAAQASMKAKEETNTLKAAQLHGKAQRANEKAAKAIKKDPSYNHIPGASNLYLTHLQKSGEHGRAAKELSEKILGGSAGLAKQQVVDAKTLTAQANTATKTALGPTGHGVAPYIGGNYNLDNRIKAYEHAADLHKQAADAHAKTGNDKKADRHYRASESLRKQVSYYRGLK
jgi:hypothetical protein